MESQVPVEVIVKIEPDERNTDEFVEPQETPLNVNEQNLDNCEQRPSYKNNEIHVEIEVKREVEDEASGENEQSSENWLDSSMELFNSSAEAQFSNSLNQGANLVYPFYNHWVSNLTADTRQRKPKSDSKRVHKCPIEGCGATFNRPGILKHHMDLHANVRKFVCTETDCNKAYASKSHLKRHMKCAHNTDYSDRQPVKIHGCPHCIRTYRSIHSLKRHVTIIHVIKAELTCDTCRKTFQTRNQLTAHMYQHTGVKAFKCDHCPEEFVTHYERKRHMRFHKDYNCPDCDAVLNHWSKFIQHRRECKARVSKNAEYICDCCNTKHPTRHHILKHFRAKQGPDNKTYVFMCPFPGCNKYYTTKNNMKQHMKVKHQRVLYDCHLCDAKLTTKLTLKNHIYKMHTRSEEERKKAPPKTLANGRKPRKDKGTFKIAYSERLAGIMKSQTKSIGTERETSSLERRQISELEQREINEDEKEIRDRIEQYLEGLREDSLSSAIVERMCAD